MTPSDSIHSINDDLTVIANDTCLLIEEIDDIPCLERLCEIRRATQRIAGSVVDIEQWAREHGRAEEIEQGRKAA